MNQLKYFDHFISNKFHDIFTIVTWFFCYFLFYFSTAPMQKFINQSKLAFSIICKGFQFLLYWNVLYNVIWWIAIVSTLMVSIAFFMEKAKPVSPILPVKMFQYLSMIKWEHFSCHDYLIWFYSSFQQIKEESNSSFSMASNRV